eukprot:6171316-Prymnesium_polylepis.1
MGHAHTCNSCGTVTWGHMGSSYGGHTGVAWGRHMGSSHGVVTWGRHMGSSYGVTRLHARLPRYRRAPAGSEARETHEGQLDELATDLPRGGHMGRHTG